ncbi:MAG: helix-turn-helix domain containing protein, partial [Cyanobacteria bacterium]|nr:helix-turn-helix domain containing protein [Cyanobacteriota bacterium]
MASQTAQQILDVAQILVRQRGYSAFSYADISDRVGIRKASIHYHFPSKDELVRALVMRYRQTFQHQRDRIAQATPDPADQLCQFAALYRADLPTDQLCLCG